MCEIQKIVEQYIPLANKIAFQKKRTLPKHVDIEDLRSAAYLGLVEAGSRFDPELGISFSTFAYPRIFGAVHDYLRSQGMVKRGNFENCYSIDSSSSDDEFLLKDSIESKPKCDIDECFEDLTVGFDEDAKLVLKYYFIDEESMKEIGSKFGVSESRICQLIKQYKLKIQENYSQAA